MQDDKIVNSSTENPLKNENIDNVLKDLPKEKREVIYSAFYAIERSYSGPLPPPEDFAKNAHRKQQKNFVNKTYQKS